MTMLRAPDRNAQAISTAGRRHGRCDSFEAELDKALRLLRGGQPRGSFVRLRFARPTGAESRRRIARALGELGIAGQTPDGGIGLLYIGPRAGGASSEDGDRQVERRLVGCLGRLLGEAGSAGRVHVELRHFWCAAVTGAAQLLDDPLAEAAAAELADGPGPRVE